jgi:hypothetical protein
MDYEQSKGPHPFQELSHIFKYQDTNMVQDDSVSKKRSWFVDYKTI